MLRCYSVSTNAPSGCRSAWSIAHWHHEHNINCNPLLVMFFVKADMPLLLISAGAQNYLMCLCSLCCGGPASLTCYYKFRPPS